MNLTSRTRHILLTLFDLPYDTNVKVNLHGELLTVSFSGRSGMVTRQVTPDYLKHHHPSWLTGGMVCEHSRVTPLQQVLRDYEQNEQGKAHWQTLTIHDAAFSDLRDILRHVANRKLSSVTTPASITQGKLDTLKEVFQTGQGGTFYLHFHAVPEHTCIDLTTKYGDPLPIFQSAILNILNRQGKLNLTGGVHQPDSYFLDPQGSFRQDVILRHASTMQLHLLRRELMERSGIHRHYHQSTYLRFPITL